ncbi:MAG: replication protein RepA [Gemmatimonadota bacterium]|nr:replication protein RepA [Gemmatimonadota bacterium]
MARILVQATLPHSRPLTHEFERVNGRFTLYMNAPASVGLPYGSYPRLALAWLSTEAVRTRSREIELGPTFSSFMYKLGLTPITGKRGTTSRLRDQLHRLFSTTIRCSYSDEDEGHAAGVGYTIAHKHELWWSPRDLDQQPLWNSVVVLSTEFYDELVAHAVPIDLRALKALKGSPLALDIYSWLTYRMSYLRKPCLIPWEALQTQFGADYGRLRDFKRKFLAHLGYVLHVYSAARLSEQPVDLLLKPSPTHLPRAPGTRRLTGRRPL